MFRASHLTSAFGGLLFGTLIGIDERTNHAYSALVIVVFFVAGFILVGGVPQYREAMQRHQDRAAFGKIHRVGDWQRFRDDLRMFYVPVWFRMLTFAVSTIIASIVVGRL
jgi:hypothetical protein